jgi:hypothetical protein
MPCDDLLSYFSQPALDQRDRTQAEAELADWLGSLSQVEFTPQCGQCKHFKFKNLVSDDGWGWCQLRRVPSYGDGCDTYEDRHMGDEVCPRFELDIPF